METELDLSSVPDGLNVPGEQGLPAWYSEMELAYEKGLMATNPKLPSGRPTATGSKPVKDGYFDQRYCERYAYYRKAMEVYLLKTLRLDVYDKQVEDSGLCFIPMPEGKKGEYQRLSALRLSHIFIYSSPHIERLSTEDVAILERLYLENGQTGTVPQEALEFAARTYTELVKEYDTVAMAPYPDGTRLSHNGTPWDASSLAIVFVTPRRYDDNGSVVLGDSDLIRQREDWLIAELPKARQQMTEKVGLPVTLVISEGEDSWSIIFDEKFKDGASMSLGILGRTGI